MKHSFFLILFFGFQFGLLAQIPEMVKAEGKIPKEFITPSSEKYSVKIAELERTKSKGKKARTEKKNKEQFYLESSFSIDDVLQSGAVLFNDPISSYVTKVLEKLPLSSKLRKSKPRVYLLNSAEVNAFATEQGIILLVLDY